MPFQRIHSRSVLAFGRRIQCLLHTVIAANDGGIDATHARGPLGRALRIARETLAPITNPIVNDSKFHVRPMKIAALRLARSNLAVYTLHYGPDSGGVARDRHAEGHGECTHASQQPGRGTQCARSISQLIIVGVSTNNSVDATARAAGNLGFETQVVADATFAFDKIDYSCRRRTAEEFHSMALANLDSEYATVVSTQRVIDTFKR